MENPNVGEHAFAELAHDEHPDVRYAVAENPRAPRSTLSFLLFDDNPYVADRARQTLERLERATIKS